MGLKDNIKKDQIYSYWKTLEDGTRKKNSILCLCLGCQVTKEVYYLYLIQGKSKSCGCMRESIRKITSLEKYGTESPNAAQSVKNKRKESCLNKYGVENPSQAEEVKKKKMITSQENYGTDFPKQNAEYQKNWENNFEQIYNVKSPSVLSHIKEKKRTTCQAKFGANSYFASTIGKEKIKETLQINYGVDNPSQILDVKNKKRIKAESTKMIKLSCGTLAQDMCDKYQISYSNGYSILRRYGEEFFLDYCKAYNKDKTTSVEKLFMDIMSEDMMVEKWNKEPVEYKTSRRPDFRLEENGKILYINVDGLFMHSEIGRSATSKDYHLKLAQIYNGNFFQFREDELLEKPLIVRSMVLNFLGRSTKIPGRKCTVRQLDTQTKNDFINKNHLMGSSTGRGFGLYYQDKLMGVMTVKRTGKGIDIVRFCNKLNHTIQGGFSKLLHHIRKIYKPTFIQSFLDLRYSSGSSYKQNNFKKVSTTLGWQWTNGRETFNRRKCRANMDSRKLTQEEYATEKKWYKIYDAGQAKYILTK